MVLTPNPCLFTGYIIGKEEMGPSLLQNIDQQVGLWVTIAWMDQLMMVITSYNMVIYPSHGFF